MTNTSKQHLGKKNNLDLIKSALEHAYIKQDKIVLHHIYSLAQDKAVEQPENLTQRHFALMAKSTLYHLDYKLTTESIQHELIDYFFTIDIWQYYDLCLFFFVHNMINVEKLKPYINDILNQYLANKLSTVADNLVAPILITFLESTIIQKNTAITKSLFLRLDFLNLFEQNMTFQTWLLFLRGLFENHKTKISDAYNIVISLHMMTPQKLFDHTQKYYQRWTRRD